MGRWDGGRWTMGWWDGGTVIGGAVDGAFGKRQNKTESINHYFILNVVECARYKYRCLKISLPFYAYFKLSTNKVHLLYMLENNIYFQCQTRRLALIRLHHK